MAVGDCETAFFLAAQGDGLQLERRYTKPWLNQQGHFGLPLDALSAKVPLHEVFLALGGDANTQASKRSTTLPGDFIHHATRTIIEVDEIQHFSTFRLQSFDFYPRDATLG